MDEESGAWMRRVQGLSGGAEEKGHFFPFGVRLAWTWLSAHLHSRSHHLLLGYSSERVWKKTDGSETVHRDALRPFHVWMCLHGVPSLRHMNGFT